MNYTCEICSKKFGQKSHYDAHKNKKFSCKKCNKNFITQYAYVNNKAIHINNYKKVLNNKPRCKNGHELVLCDGINRKKYFRHKNQSDLNNNHEMSEWHCKWQGFFPITEVEFKKESDKQIKNRRADVVLNDKYILEVQHSNIEYSEIICRTQDYKLHDKELIWVVDGNTKDVILDKLSDSTYLIEFNNNWKYKSFIYNYQFILLDIDEHIFKIPVNSVCNKMIHVKEYIKIDDLVNALKNNPGNIWNLWKDVNEIKPILKIKQQGAGNGKTFGIWKNISLNFDKELYIITTKQHTAKDVILNELNEQAKRKEFHIVDNMEELDDYKYKRQYLVIYKHIHSSRQCMVIIGTIDSFIYSLTSKSIGGNSFFEGLLKNICVNGCDKINTNTGEINYGGKQIKLNKMTELWIDETQDLSIDYYKAILKLMLNTKIDCVIVGDKLQSLEYEQNFMSYIEDDDDIKIIREEPKNINRRIKVKNMADKINALVHFKEYDVPEIHIENSDELEDRGDNVIETFEQTCIYANDTDKQKINDEADKIIKMVEHEINQYNYKPEDFLFLFPIMKNNLLACELETKLNKFWLEKLGNDEVYKQYAVLHKHEEGQIIDTTKSIEAARIMSITSAKGDGRSVDFVLNCTEQSLKIVSNNKKNIVYESFLHVALTRAKHKIYFGLQHNNDDIHKRFAEVDENIEYIPQIKHKFNIDAITQYIDKDNCIKLLENNKICEKEHEEEENDYTSSSIIDWDYHCIRHAVYYNYALFEMFKHNKDAEIFKKTQLKVVLDKISNLNIRSNSPNEFYKYLKTLKENDELRHFPLCNLSHQKIYQTYYNKIKGIIENIQTKYKDNNLTIGSLSPEESSILIYLIDVFMNKKFHDYTPTTIYNIIHSFEQKNNIEKLMEESKNMKHIMENLMENILKNENIEWNIEHIIKFNGNTNELNLYNRFNIIGNNEKNVYHLLFQTDYNKLNYSDTMIKILLERFLIQNASSNDREKNNKTRYSGKKITTYLLILKQNKYEIFDWEFENTIDNDIKMLCKTGFIKYFKNYNKELFNYCKCIKQDKSKWCGCKSPYQFLAKKKEFENNSYIKNFFNNLDEECKTDLKNVKKITDNFNLFEEKINEYIVDMSETYFGFNIVDDDLEW
tara:strand:+ start:587 stop:3997 length:3411 start_codon:yes stop_codon:yes gene_type:complete